MLDHRDAEIETHATSGRPLYLAPQMRRWANWSTCLCLTGMLPAAHHTRSHFRKFQSDVVIQSQQNNRNKKSPRPCGVPGLYGHLNWASIQCRAQPMPVIHRIVQRQPKCSEGQQQKRVHLNSGLQRRPPQNCKFHCLDPHRD